MNAATLEIEPKTKTTEPSYIKWFREITIEDVPIVGGKTASLGEIFRELTPKGVNVPDGFGVTAQAFLDFLHHTGLDAKIFDRGLKRDDTVLKTTAAILETERAHA
jgi:phosphoenolpyruvate synthase/pyruvate phosphate dikinase